MRGGGAAVVCLALLTGCGSGSDDGAAYPAGPYGLKQGDTIAAVRLFDSDGKAVDVGSYYRGRAPALLLYVTATWCFTCGPEVGWLNDYAARTSGDLAAMSVLLQNKQFEDATAADAAAFSDGYGAEFVTLLDPEGAFDLFRQQAFIPLNLLIDTSTMRITLRETGFDRASLEAAITTVVNDAEQQ